MSFGWFWRVAAKMSQKCPKNVRGASRSFVDVGKGVKNAAKMPQNVLKDILKENGKCWHTTSTAHYGTKAALGALSPQHYSMGWHLVLEQQMGMV